MRTARKLSISVPPEVEEIIKAAAHRAGQPVSAWLAEAAAEKAAAEEALRAGRAAAAELVADYESTGGPLPEEARRRARTALQDAGLLTPEVPAPRPRG